MTKLYDISKDYLALLESDLPQDQFIDCLDNMKDAFDEKANNVLAVASTISSDVDAIDAQIKRLQARKKSMVNNIDRLKEYLRYNMEVSGITKISHPFFSVTLGKPTVTAEVLDVDDLPDDYVSVKTEIKPDKRKILKDLKEGALIPGAALSEGKSRLLIK